MRSIFALLSLSLFADMAQAENKTSTWHTIGGAAYKESKGTESCGKEVREYIRDKVEHVKVVTLSMNTSNGEATIQIDAGKPTRVADIDKVKDARVVTAPVAVMLFLYENGDGQLVIMRTATADSSKATCTDAYAVSLD